MSIPRVITPSSLGDYLEVMSKAVFQAGIRWSTIDEKWDAFRSVFYDFDVHKVAAFATEDIERLSGDERILRSPRKIAATVDNAKTLIKLDQEHNGFANYLHAFSSYEKLAANLKKQFKFMGEMNAYYFLFRVGEPVPDFDEWVKTIPGDHPRMKEMVELERNKKQVVE
ncbi:MAG: DNA-3-methyladenine glycosylase I [Candidatus Obscuribacterales bacterium]|nr:DNA-3-methyladenine glycosylase I [Candidatus Obscuribacterales bacterium]